MRRALIVISVLALAACNMVADAQEGDRPSGRTETRTYDLAGFDSVSLGGPHDVVVTVGPAASVRAEGDADEIERMEIKVDGRALEIGTRRDSGRMFGRNRGKVTVYVTMPSIRAASIGGSGDMKIDKAEGERFAASIGGSGDIDIASMRVGSADFSIAGSGGIRGAGTADRAEVSIAGSGNIDLAALETADASVSIVGSGDVRMRATRTADVSLMGSGDVTLSGGAKCDITKMGSGTVRCNA